MGMNMVGGIDSSAENCQHLYKNRVGDPRGQRAPYHRFLTNLQLVVLRRVFKNTHLVFDVFFGFVFS